MALGLRWEDLRPDRGEALLIDTKTGTRWSSVSTETLVMLDALPRRGPCVFHGKSRDGNLGYNAVSDLLHRVCEQAKVRNVTPHVFRASTATAMVEAGADLFALRDSFGWRGLAMPNRYVQTGAAIRP